MAPCPFSQSRGWLIQKYKSDRADGEKTVLCSLWGEKQQDRPVFVFTRKLSLLSALTITASPAAQISPREGCTTPNMASLQPSDGGQQDKEVDGTNLKAGNSFVPTSTGSLGLIKPLPVLVVLDLDKTVGHTSYYLDLGYVLLLYLATLQ